MATAVFTVWSADRELRKSLTSTCNVQAVIAKASSPEYLNRRGARLVLEQDGTEVTDNDVLEHFAGLEKVLLLLCHHERWTSAIDNNSGRPNRGQCGEMSSNDPPAYDTVSDSERSPRRRDSSGTEDLLQVLLLIHALELHERKEERNFRRTTNNRSLAMAALGGAAIVGGAAASVAAAPVVAAAGGAALLGGAAAELFGLAGYLRSA